MARIKLELPGTAVFQTDMPVRITDINYGQHLGNDTLVSFLHDVRVQWLRRLHHTELDIEGRSLIQSELVVNYLGEAFAGDILHFALHIGDVRGSGFELYYEVTTERNGQPYPIARARTGMVFFDYETRKVMPVPEGFRQRLTEN